MRWRVTCGITPQWTGGGDVSFSEMSSNLIANAVWSCVHGLQHAACCPASLAIRRTGRILRRPSKLQAGLVLAYPLRRQDGDNDPRESISIQVRPADSQGAAKFSHHPSKSDQRLSPV